MKIVRLLRRASLCFLVGLTTFGLSGYLLRPQPTWTVELGGGSWDFIDGNSDAAASPAPIWLRSGYRPPKLFEARDPTDGAILQRTDMGPRLNFHLPAPDRVRVEHIERADGDKVSTCFETFVADSPYPVRIDKFPGYWDFTGDGRNAWKGEKTPAGFTLSMANLETGEVAAPRLFAGYHVTSSRDCRLSADGRLIAFCERDRKDRQPPFGIDLVDIRSGERRQRIAPPEAVGFATDPGFEDGASELHFSWDSGQPGVRDSYWRCRLADGRIERFPFAPPAPPPMSSTSEVTRSYPLQQKDAWISSDGKSRACFTLERDERLVFPWREFPFPILRNLGGQWGEQMLYVKEVPTRDELVTTSAGASPASYLPEALQVRVLSDWSRDHPHVKHHWHDWRRNVWRDVGCPPTVYRTQLHPRTLLTLSFDPEHLSVLQSWPLPPRDPRWPAAGVGVAAAALVWYLCARRAKRVPRMAA